MIMFKVNGRSIIQDVQDVRQICRITCRKLGLETLDLYVLCRINDNSVPIL